MCFEVSAYRNFTSSASSLPWCMYLSSYCRTPCSWFCLSPVKHRVASVCAILPLESWSRTSGLTWRKSCCRNWGPQIVRCCHCWLVVHGGQAGPTAWGAVGHYLTFFLAVPGVEQDDLLGWWCCPVFVGWAGEIWRDAGKECKQLRLQGRKVLKPSIETEGKWFGFFLMSREERPDN